MQKPKAVQPSIRICLLGEFCIYFENQKLSSKDFPGKKAPALLKLLVLQPKHQLIKDQVIDILWPQLQVKEGSAQLYKAIYHIRKVFNKKKNRAGKSVEILELKDELLRLKLPDGITTDIQEFEESARRGLDLKQLPDLEKARNLYSGDLLPMDLYAEWAVNRRDRLRQMYLEVLLVLIRQYHLKNDLLAATECAQQALSSDPLLEEAHQELMKVYALQHQPNRAASQLKKYKDLLWEELGIEVSQQTIKLAEEIQNGRFKPPEKKRNVFTSPSSPFFNRKEECKILKQFLLLLQEHQGGLLFFEGPAGIGKSSLMAELAFHARLAGFYTYTGKAYEEEGPVVYGPFVEVLHAALKESSEGEEFIPAEIAYAIPHYSSKRIFTPQSDQHSAQGYLFAGVFNFLKCRSANTPLVIMLEDMHSADEGSYALLHYLARKITDIPILLAVSFRNEREVGRRIDAQYRGLTLPVEICSLKPFSETEQLELLESKAENGKVPETLNKRIYAISEGNPLFALCLYEIAGESLLQKKPLTTLTYEGDLFVSEIPLPSHLNYLVLKKVNKLSSQARFLLNIAATAGRIVSFEFLSLAWRKLQGDASNSSESRFLDLLELLIKEGLWEEKEGNYHFTNGLFRLIIYQSMSQARRRSLHVQLAHLLLSGQPQQEKQPVEKISFHFYKAGNAMQAAHYLVLAAERAAAAYSHQDAINRYEEAKSLLDSQPNEESRALSVSIYEKIGDLYRISGYLEKCFPAYEAALSILKDQPSGETASAMLHAKLSLAALYIMQMDQAREQLDKAWSINPKDEKTQATLLIIHALYLWHLNQLPKAAEKAHKALRIAESISSSTLAAQACEMLAMTYLPLGKWEEGVAYEQRKHSKGWSPDIVLATDSHLCLWEFYMHGDAPFQQAENFIHKLSKQAEKQGNLRCVAICHYALGTMYLWRGNAAASLQELQKSLKLHHTIGSPTGMAYVLARKASLYTVEGKLDKGYATIQEGLEMAEQAALRDHCHHRLFGAALWNRLEAEDAPAVAGLVDRSEELMKTNGTCVWCSMELIPWLSLYYVRHQQYGKAEVHEKTIRHLSSMTGHPVGKAVSIMVQSCLESGRGNKKSSAHLQEKANELIKASTLKSSNSYLTSFFSRIKAL